MVKPGHAMNCIGGAWTAPRTGEQRTILSPIDGAEIGAIAWSGREDAVAAIAAARTALPAWRKTSVFHRAKACRRIADAIRSHRDELAALLCVEQGKPMPEAWFEVGKAADGFDLAASLAPFLEGATIPAEDPRKRVMTFYQPRGVYAVITPWNFPVNIPVEYLAPGIAAGNTIVWVPAPTTSLCAVALMNILLEADLPHGVINLVTGAGAVVGDEAVVNPGTDAIGFTGSSATGRRIVERSPGKSHLMELGGNGPVIVLNDANLEAAAVATASGCFTNAGQVCSSSERVLVHRAVYDEFAERMVAEAKKIVVGDPRKQGVTMGPLNNATVAEKVAAHVADATARGARILTGGGRPDGAATPLYFSPTVLRDVSRDSLLNLEESFGPVAPLIAVDSDDDALAVAGANRYGLVASVFTRDMTRAFRFIDVLQAGIVNVNDTSNYWELHIPFGGASGKESGVGRLGGRHTLLAMSDLRTATITVDG
jgi:succinate-semialdehyde dehydrogenase/glutarate-semialdehyde dehydrogenase